MQPAKPALARAYEPLLRRLLRTKRETDRAAMAAAFEGMRVIRCVHVSTPMEFAAGGVRLVDVGLNLSAASLIDDLASFDVAGVGVTRSRRPELALDTVHAFADHDVELACAFAVDDDVERLSRFRHAHGDSFIVHLKSFPLQSTTDRR